MVLNEAKLHAAAQKPARTASFRKPSPGRAEFFALPTAGSNDYRVALPTASQARQRSRGGDPSDREHAIPPLLHASGS
jgi:hypothetical protein